MARISLPFGERTIEARCPRLNVLDTLVGPAGSAPAIPDQQIRDTLNASRFGQSFREAARGANLPVIVVSDAFRTTAADRILPFLLRALDEANVPGDSIQLLVATGTHRAPLEDELRNILGAHVYSRMRNRLQVHDASDSANLVTLGTTRRGTPVEVNSLALESDCVIVIAAVAYHYFAGFGGGRKSIVPGLAGARTIAHNHALNLHPIEDQLDPQVQIGKLDGNPVAEDLEEAAAMCPPAYAIHTFVDADGQLIDVVAGDPDPSFREATKRAAALFAVPCTNRADIVFAAAPATRDFLQTHKALYNAFRAVTGDGLVVLAAPCTEGLGPEQFVKWLRLGNRKAIIEGLRRSSEINGQTALSTIDKGPRTILVTRLRDDEVRLIGARSARTLQEAADLAVTRMIEKHSRDAKCYLMPQAHQTVPIYTI